MTDTRPPCPNILCDERCQMVKVRAVNGAYHVGWRCYGCGGYLEVDGGRWLKQEGLILDDIPTVHQAEERICQVCGRRGPTEDHHFGPRAVFCEEADDWPSWVLCITMGDEEGCHERWHRLMGMPIREVTGPLASNPCDTA